MVAIDETTLMDELVTAKKTSGMIWRVLKSVANHTKMVVFLHSSSISCVMIWAFTVMLVGRC